MSESRETPWIGRLGQALVRVCVTVAVRRNWFVIGAALVLAGLSAYAATGLTVSTEMKEILSGDLKFFQAENRYREVFRQQEPVVVVVDADSSTKAHEAAARLADRLKRREDLFERVAVAGDSPFFRRYALLFLDVPRLQATADRLVQSQPLLSIVARDPSLRGLVQFVSLVQSGVSAGRDSPELAEIINELAKTTAARARGEPATMIWDTLAKVDGANAGNRALITIEPVVSDPSIFSPQPALQQVQAAVSAIRADYPDATLRVTGFPELRQQELNEVFSGAAYASVLSFVLVSLSLLLIRSWRIVVALVIALVIGSIITTGLAAVSVGRLNLISIAFLVLFFGLGVDFGTHFGLRYLEETNAGAAFRDAVMRAGLGEAPAIGLSALCASIGFLSFVPTAHVGLSEFGIISTLGILVGVVITFVLLPALMTVIPPKPQTRAGLQIGIGDQVRRHYRIILILAALGTVVAGVLAPRIRLDVNLLNMQNPETEAVKTYRDLANNPSTSPYSVDAIAENQDAARELARRLAGVQGVAEVRTAESFVPVDQAPKLEILRETARRLGPVLESRRRPSPTDDELQKAFADLRSKASEIGSNGERNSPTIAAARSLTAALDGFGDQRGTEPSALRQLGAGLTGMLPETLDRLRAMVSVAGPISFNDIPAELRREWIAPDGRARVQVLPESRVTTTETFESFARGVQSIAPDATGVPIGVTEAGAAVAWAFMQAIAYSVAAIVIVILVLRRSFLDLLLVLTPLALASLWTVAAATLLGFSFNFANVIVIPLILGLGVASSIHMVVRAREGARGDVGDVLETSTPLAVFVAQLNTAAAFATLAIAEHRGLFSMGVLLGLSIVFVLIASLVVLPAAMVLWEHTRPLLRRHPENRGEAAR
jgi:hopanoid biosynthesis associated RND transporter like protein HpnN